MRSGSWSSSSRVLCAWRGIKLIALGVRSSGLPPAIPTARLANLDGVDGAYATAARLAEQAPRNIGRGLVITFGLGWIAAPWLASYAMLSCIAVGP